LVRIQALLTQRPTDRPTVPPTHLDQGLDGGDAPTYWEGVEGDVRHAQQLVERCEGKGGRVHVLEGVCMGGMYNRDNKHKKAQAHERIFALAPLTACVSHQHPPAMQREDPGTRWQGAYTDRPSYGPIDRPTDFLTDFLTDQPTDRPGRGMAGRTWMRRAMPAKRRASDTYRVTRMQRRVQRRVQRCVQRRARTHARARMYVIAVILICITLPTLAIRSCYIG
jgi:hypothetical protein